MSSKIKILLAEDDVNLGFLLVDFLEINGFDAKLYKDGETALRGFLNNTFDFCILDIMLPGINGFEIAKSIRNKNTIIPIIFLTAKSLKEDKIYGYKIGIDDYIVKPFDEEELLCKINAICKRANVLCSLENIDNYRIGKYYFDFKNQILTINENKKRLTKKESEILMLFCKNKNQIVKREDILTNVWGSNDYFLGRSLDVFITKLRKYLGEDKNLEIKNIPSVGYELTEN
jgi:DNA-binding response OmpR family regulator